MVLTSSTMLELGTKAPSFLLTDVVSGKSISPDSLPGKKGLLVMFICRHCPYVKHIKDELASLGNDCLSKGVSVVAISSNDAKNYPDDAPHQLKAMAEELSFAFPFCFDESQAVAQAYKAACTPDFFLFDAALTLVYRGQLDESRPGNDIPVTGSDLRAAVAAILQGQKPTADQKSSVGCNIKWKPGNEPKY